MGDMIGVVPPPAGVTADFDFSNPWKFKTNVALIGIGLSLSTLVLSMRVYTRTHILRQFGWDDGRMPPALIIQVPLCKKKITHNS